MDEDERRDLYVSLREHYDRILVEHDRMHAAEHRAVFLAADELSRRLEVLNHAHQQSVEDRSDFVLRDKFETHVDTVNRRFKTVETFQARATGIAVVLAGISGLIGAAIMKGLGG